ncbi:hypothetical protein ACTFIY_000172 [Dictyostelium cf. discoideum]
MICKSLFCKRYTTNVIFKSRPDVKSGWCTCDGNIKGLNCDQLNANISSVLTPTISSGDVIMSGYFSNIYNISSSITFSIGTSISPCSVECSLFGKYSVTPTFVSGGQVYLNGNFSNVKDLILQCTTEKGEGIKDIIISSGLLSFSKASALAIAMIRLKLDSLQKKKK